MSYNLRKRPQPVAAITPVKKIKKIKEPETSETGLYSFGSDSCGELGLGKIGIERLTPGRVPISETVENVACGAMHVICLTTSGKIYTYGCNDEGALGRVTDGDDKLEATPTEVPLPAKAIKVTAGDSHSAVLTKDQQVYIFGNFRDEHGSIGLTPEADGQPLLQPTRIMQKLKFKDIASGSNHMLLLASDGTVYSFGVGEQGQLGRLEQEQVENIAITKDNRETFLRPQKVSFDDVDPKRTFICDAVFAGNFSSFATNTDKKKNRLAGWGLNNCFQLGYKGRKGQLVQHVPKRSTFTCSTSMTSVACGQHHTLFLTKTGRVYSAGKHLYGMLGLGSSIKEEVCPARFIESLGNSILDISAGINTSFAVNRTGQLLSWGMSGTNLGIKTEDDQYSPVQVTSLDGMRVKSVSAGASFTAVVI